jgi:Domain of unknown function (DUF4926)
MKVEYFELLDAIVLDKDLPALGLRRGTIGTIVEVINADTFLVEFAATNGESYAMEFLKASQLLKVHQAPMHIAA